MTGAEQLVVDRPAADDARRAADSAAHAAGVVIRELADLSDLAAVEQLFDSIWRPEVTPLNTEMLRAFAAFGNYVTGAFADDTLVGACVGFFGPPAANALHSHIAGVAPDATRRAIGYALKLHQRAWSLLHGVTAIEWTFDPLVARNAFFNQVKLGARPVRYLPNFYGGMRDVINGDDETDRLLMRWELGSSSVQRTLAGERSHADAEREAADGAVAALRVSARGEPMLGPIDAATLLVHVPREIEAVRVSDPAQANRWRLAVRTVLGGLLADGATVSGFDRSGCYVVRRADDLAEGKR